MPICYASRSLTECERRYSQTEKEALALVWACKRYHAYIYGMRFDLVTDHKPLEVIYGPCSKPSARIERWVIRLQPYDFRVVYAPGQSNVAEFQEYCVQNGIMHLRTTPKWPQANGEVERQNASLMKKIRIAQAEVVN